jgi:uncharacterized membrane protein YoaK (UPF0700 family)
VSAAEPTPPYATLGTAALLSVSGGFLDAFTYVGHGHVFANAMTGNVVLLGVFGAAGQWAAAWRHVPPIVAFVLGVLAAQWMAGSAPSRRLRYPGLACLIVEILFLCGAAWLPPSFPDLWLVLGLSFVAALQNSSFPKVEDWAYNSVMTTGNLRRFAEGLFLLLQAPPQRSEGLRQARAFGVVCGHFLLGAILGALCTTRLGNPALLIPALLLGLVLLRIVRGMRAGKPGIVTT